MRMEMELDKTTEILTTAISVNSNIFHLNSFLLTLSPTPDRMNIVHNNIAKGLNIAQSRHEEPNTHWNKLVPCKKILHP